MFQALEPPRARGVVYLVGAGPGDPGLLTMRAFGLLQRADVVLYDHLVSEAVLACCHPAAERISVGKIGHGHQTPQDTIVAQMIAFARTRDVVVRLKGGDPLLFGRGAEEALALDDAGIPFEIVPGVSSALAAPAAAGIPLTARHIARSVAIVTGHCTHGDPAPIPNADTVVVLMGTSNARAIRESLLEEGRPPDTPAAAVQWGTCPAQRVVAATLETLPDVMAAEGIGAPAVIVIGEVVGLRDRLAADRRRVRRRRPERAASAMV